MVLLYLLPEDDLLPNRFKPMFSLAQKQKLAAEIEALLLAIKHPEMPEEKPNFTLHVEGKESWSWANIKPNWTFTEENPPGINPWNEMQADRNP